MGYRENWYDLVLVLHLLSVIVGFGGVILNGLYGAQAQAAGGIEGLAITRANHKVSNVAEKVIYLVPVFGIGLVFMSDGAIKFSEPWVWLALLLYAALIAAVHAVMVPGVNRMIALMEELNAAPVPAGGAPAGPPPQVAEMEAIGKRLGVVGPILALTIAAIVFLMVFKPGGNVL